MKTDFDRARLAKRSRKSLAATASGLALAIAFPAVAQVAEQATITNPASEADIVVTGIRGSLQRNLDIKRNSAGVVDVISAEDIGKFPDSNVAASLQRLPGVSINRSGSRGEPDGGRRPQWNSRVRIPRVGVRLLQRSSSVLPSLLDRTPVQQISAMIEKSAAGGVLISKAGMQLHPR